MRVRITKANKSTYWYANKIGEVFDAVRHVCYDGERGYRVEDCRDGTDTAGFVDGDDCEVVKDDAYEPQVTVLTDDTLGGVQREYSEVKRKANVGERIKIVDSEGHGHALDSVWIVTNADHVWGGYRSDGTGVTLDDGRPVYHRRYVVLEPTDVIVVDGRRYRMVERQANVGERVIVTKTPESYFHFRVGDIGVADAERGWDDKDIHVTFLVGKQKYIGPSASKTEYRVLEPLDDVSDAPTKFDAESEIAALKERVAALEALTTVGTPQKTPVATETSSAPKTTTRDDIVKQAKKDVATLELIGDDIDARLDGSVRFRSLFYRVEFVVNRDKRVVTALVRYKYGDDVKARGVAKCAPDECFNVHIGKAIALRRALELDVPVEYVKAPQPTEVRVGDVVCGKHAPGRNYYSIDKTFTLASERANCGFHYAENRGDWIFTSDIGRIIDDSRESDA